MSLELKKCLIKRCGCLSQRLFFRRFLLLQKKTLDRQTQFSQGCDGNLKIIASEIRKGAVQHTAAINNQTASMREMFDELKKTDTHIKELDDFKENKPSCYSFWLPIVVLFILALLLFLPLQCSAQSECNCCCKDTQKKDTSPTIQLNINCDSLLRIICSDTTTMKREIELSSGHIIVKPHEYAKWSLIVYRIVIAIIILIGLILMLKYLVPYWTKIAELNDKQKERLVKLAEERLEFERLPRKTEIEIMERQARANMDEDAKASESKRSIEKMMHDHKSHLVDLALEITKVYDQSKDASSINQIIQNLK